MQGTEISCYKYRLRLNLRNQMVSYKICSLSYSLKLWMHNHVKILLIGSIIAHSQR